MTNERALEAIKAAYEELGRFMDEFDWALLDKCDCGCRRIGHAPPRHDAFGRAPCFRCDDCSDFDDLHQRADRWRAERNGAG